MFRDAPKSYKNNPFLEAVSKPGVFSQFFYEGTYKQLDALFYKGWTDKVVARLNISKGLFLSCFLADLYGSIQSVCGFNCFGKVKAKLEAVDDDFLPTVFEVEMAEFILGIFKGSVSDMEFAGCFKTKGDKKIDFRAKIQEQWVYFEMTKVMDYKGCADVLRLYNLVSAFLVGVQITSGRKLGLELVFQSMPNQDTIDIVINQLTKWLIEKKFDFKGNIKDIYFHIEEKRDSPKLKLHVISNSLSNKLKDKYFEELEHFADGDINVIVIDTTYLPDGPLELKALTDKIFETEGNLSIVAAVILVCNEYVIEPNGFPIGKKVGQLIVFNKRCDKAELLRKVLNCTIEKKQKISAENSQ